MWLQRHALTYHSELPLVTPRESQAALRTGQGEFSSETSQAETEISAIDLVAPSSQTLVSKSVWIVLGAIGAAPTIEITQEPMTTATKILLTNVSAKLIICAVRLVTWLFAPGRHSRNLAGLYNACFVHQEQISIVAKIGWITSTQHMEDVSAIVAPICL